MKIVTTESTEYECEKVYRKFSTDPCIILIATTVNDLPIFLLFCKKYELKIILRSTKNALHRPNFKNFCLIDVSLLQNKKIDFQKKRITVQCGVTQMDICKDIQHTDLFVKTSNKDISYISCALGCDITATSRIFGLDCYSILEFKLVNKDGKTLSCSNSINKDLFWALKGYGNQNFGIVTECTIQLFKQPSLVIEFKIEFPLQFFMQLYIIWQKKILTYGKLNLSISFQVIAKYVFIQGFYFGPNHSELDIILKDITDIEDGQYTKNEVLFTDFLIKETQTLINPIDEKQLFMKTNLNTICIEKLYDLLTTTNITFECVLMSGNIATHLHSVAFDFQKAPYMLSIKLFDFKYLKTFYDIYDILNKFSFGSHYCYTNNYEISESLQKCFPQNALKLSKIKLIYNPFQFF